MPRPPAFDHHLHFGPDDPALRGFQEVVLSVTDLERWVDLFERVFGWVTLTRQASGPELRGLWSLGPEVSIREAVLHQPGDREGFLRLVSFGGVARQQIRSAAQTWDTGGIFDVNLRARDLPALFRALEAAGWNGLTAPHRYVFGPYDVSEVLMRGPDGVVLALMQRFAPPLEGFDAMGTTSRFFNSSVIVRDMAAARDFYVRQLGFTPFFRTAGDRRTAETNVLGIPPSINPTVTVPIDIVRPDPAGTGSVEYLRLEELPGLDFADRAQPPNLGILLYRFPVRDAAAYAATLEGRGVALHAPLTELDLPPYGRVRTFAVRSPDGVWLEFLQLLAPPAG